MFGISKSDGDLDENVSDVLSRCLLFLQRIFHYLSQHDKTVASLISK